MTTLVIKQSPALQISTYSSTTNSSRKDLVDELIQTQYFEEMMRDGSNRYCADCNHENPTWVSSNLGAFICISCSGCHRQLGTHISKVKSMSLDRWTSAELENIKLVGNKKVNEHYEAFLPYGKPKPQASREHRSEYIISKYVKKSFVNGNGIMRRSLDSVSPKSSSTPVDDQHHLKATTASTYDEEDMPDFSAIAAELNFSPASPNKSKSFILGSPEKKKRRGLFSRTKSFDIQQWRKSKHKKTPSDNIGMVEFQGILTIHLKRGINLVKKDLNGSSDPYVKIYTGPDVSTSSEFYPGQVMKSKVIKRNLNPEWNETMSCCVCNTQTDALHIQCKDWDLLNANEPMGDKSILIKDLGLVSGAEPVTRIIKLDNVKKGEIELEISYQQLA
jgi:hypothetical protein